MDPEKSKRPPFSGDMMAFLKKNQSMYVMCMLSHQRVCLLEVLTTVA